MCDDILNHCVISHDKGFWSSRTKANVSINYSKYIYYVEFVFLSGMHFHVVGIYITELIKRIHSIDFYT